MRVKIIFSLYEKFIGVARCPRDKKKGRSKLKQMFLRRIGRKCRPEAALPTPRALEDRQSQFAAIASEEAGTGSIHLPCSRMRSCKRSTASASGMLNFTGVFPT